MSNKEKSPKDIAMEKQVAEWQRLYTHFLARKNKFYTKLSKANRPTHTSAKYAELDAEVKKYFQLIRDNRKPFQPL